MNTNKTALGAFYLNSLYSEDALFYFTQYIHVCDQKVLRINGHEYMKCL